MDALEKLTVDIVALMVLAAFVPLVDVLGRIAGAVLYELLEVLTHAA